MISILVTLIIGGLAGWVASLIVNRNEQMGIVWNVVVGIVGALLANWLLAPIFGVPADLNNPSIGSFLMAVLGSVVLLVIVNLITRRSLR